MKAILFESGDQCWTVTQFGWDGIAGFG